MTPKFSYVRYMPTMEGKPKPMYFKSRSAIYVPSYENQDIWEIAKALERAHYMLDSRTVIGQELMWENMYSNCLFFLLGFQDSRVLQSTLAKEIIARTTYVRNVFEVTKLFDEIGSLWLACSLLREYPKSVLQYIIQLHLQEYPEIREGYALIQDIQEHLEWQDIFYIFKRAGFVCLRDFPTFYPLIQDNPDTRILSYLKFTKKLLSDNPSIKDQNFRNMLINYETRMDLHYVGLSRSWYERRVNLDEDFVRFWLPATLHEDEEFKTADAYLYDLWNMMENVEVRQDENLVPTLHFSDEEGMWSISGREDKIHNGVADKHSSKWIDNFFLTQIREDAITGLETEHPRNYIHNFDSLLGREYFDWMERINKRWCKSLYKLIPKNLGYLPWIADEWQEKLQNEFVRFVGRGNERPWSTSTLLRFYEVCKLLTYDYHTMEIQPTDDLMAEYQDLCNAIH